MQMAVIQMPSRGKKDETGMITKWYKRTGDWVAEGDELFSFDTDDGSYTVKSQKAGRLVAIFVPEGELVHCPTDVGMLSSPSPDSALRAGRMQFLDENKPRVAPGADPEPAAPPAEEPDPEPAQELEPGSEPEPALEEEPTDEEEPAEEAEIPALPVEMAPGAPADELPEEAADVPEEEAADAPEEEAAAPEEIPEAPQEAAEPEEAATEDDAPQEEAAPQEEQAPEEETAPEDDAPQEEAEAEPEEDALPEPRPASLTRRVDMTLCQEIAARTGVTLAAMVRFAALRAAPAGVLEPLEDESLRGMSGRELPNIADLSAYGVTAGRRAGCGTCFVVPAVEEAVRRGRRGAEVYPALALTLCFDERELTLEKAASLLQRTSENLENFWDLLL